MSLGIYTSAAFVTASGLGVAGSASVEIRDESSGALATIYSDRNGATPISNPLTADSSGRFEFYAVFGSYKITVTKGAESYVLRYQDVVHVNEITSVALSSSNVTLSAGQYGNSLIVLSGTLTANVNLVFPNIIGQWRIINNCTGSYTVTAKTAAGTGVAIGGGDKVHIVCDAVNVIGTTVLQSSLYSSNVANGYQRLSGGLIMQWGSATVSDNGTITFPIAFPTAQLFGIASDGTNSGSAASQVQIVGVAPDTFSTINMKVRIVDNAGSATSGLVFWIAIGH